MRFTALPVGQGTGTLIQILSDMDDIPIESVLIDLGSLFWKVQKTGVPSRAFLVERLKEMHEPALDAVFLSHGDADHINLIKGALAQFKKPSEHAPRRETLEVRRVWYAGSKGDYTKGVPVLKELNAWRPDPPGHGVLKTLGPDAVDWVTPTYQSANGLEIWVMAGDTVTAATGIGAASPTRLKNAPKSYANNTVSLVLAVAYGDPEKQWIVATGDATGLTMARCNDVMRASPDWQAIAPVLCLSLPHHGSESTTYNVLGATTAAQDTKALAIQNVREFVNYLKPQTLSVSSGEWPGYRLPRARAIGDFSVHCTAPWFEDPALPADQHFYTAYYARDQMKVIGANAAGLTRWPPGAGWQTARTYQGIFTNDYYEGPADAHVPIVVPLQSGVPADSVSLDDTKQPYDPIPYWVTGWAWDVDESGADPTVTPVCDLARASAEDRAKLEELHGPLPPHRFVFLPPAALRDAPAGTAPPPPATVPEASRPAAEPSQPRRARRVRQLP